jgi:hypothetical protein
MTELMHYDDLPRLSLQWIIEGALGAPVYEDEGENAREMHARRFRIHQGTANPEDYDGLCWWGDRHPASTPATPAPDQHDGLRYHGDPMLSAVKPVVEHENTVQLTPELRAYIAGTTPVSKKTPKPWAKGEFFGLLMFIYICSVVYFLNQGNDKAALVFPPFIALACATIIMMFRREL